MWDLQGGVSACSAVCSSCWWRQARNKFPHVHSDVSSQCTVTQKQRMVCTVHFSLQGSSPVSVLQVKQTCLDDDVTQIKNVSWCIQSKSDFSHGQITVTRKKGIDVNLCSIALGKSSKCSTQCVIPRWGPIRIAVSLTLRCNLFTGDQTGSSSHPDTGGHLLEHHNHLRCLFGHLLCPYVLIAVCVVRPHQTLVK